MEKPFKMGETLKETSEGLDIKAEVMLVNQRLKELKDAQVSKKEETDAMRELGLQRARLFGWPNTYAFTKAMGEMVIGHFKGNLPIVIIRPTVVTGTYREPFPGWLEGVKAVDPIIVTCGRGKLSYFIGNLESILDVIPGDMVVNAAIVAMVGHANHHNSFQNEDDVEDEELNIYHVGSFTNREAMSFAKVVDYAYHYFSKKPWIGRDGNSVTIGVKPVSFPTMASFQKHIYTNYILPMKERKTSLVKISFVKRLVELYEPYLLFNGSFDDSTTERLRMTMRANEAEAETFHFDPKCINWEDYFMNIHIPGLVKYVLKLEAPK
ncbi:Male sterility [Macleaya cordata]|uniref:Fatty acyl-CoA reductase n=1 Tax=Macleaya cordata TaxID=56857 RepID=A0A200QB85_MACCD|nr:Male sterility [Macleaya cordata]